MLSCIFKPEKGKKEKKDCLSAGAESFGLFHPGEKSETTLLFILEEMSVLKKHDRQLIRKHLAKPKATELAPINDGSLKSFSSELREKEPTQHFFIFLKKKEKEALDDKVLKNQRANIFKVYTFIRRG